VVEEREPTPSFAAEPEPEPDAGESIFDAEPEPEPVYDPNLNAEPEPLQLTDAMFAQPEQQYMPEPQMQYPPPQDYGYAPHLVSDPVGDAASASIAGLAQAVSRERALALGNQGLTIEQLVREICTPILKHWLDTNLPYLVERIVKQEIERIVTRSERM
jgi:cell pole-organizing protein PopZ